MNARTAVLLATIVIAALLLTSVLYIVGETQQVIIMRFGEPVGVAITELGLHIKIPFIQRVNYFDKRFLEWDDAANQVPTRDKRFIWVDTYARWRISDPRVYMERLRGDEATAQSRLDDILDGETRNSVARHDLVQVVRTTNRQRFPTVRHTPIFTDSRSRVRDPPLPVKAATRRRRGRRDVRWGEKAHAYAPPPASMGP